MYQFLRNVSLFADLPDADLFALCERVEEVTLPADTLLFAEGDSGDKAYIIKEGQIEVVKESHGRRVLLAVRSAGDVIGEVALLREAPRMASVLTRQPTTLLSISKETLDDLLATSPSAARAMLRTILQRWEATQAQLQQSEQLAQLGTLTAGIAHELNNPAAAVRRSASQLQEALRTLLQAQRALNALTLNAGQQQLLDAQTEHSRQRAHSAGTLDALTRSDREYDVESWLDAAQIDEAWALAPTLVELDFDADRLSVLAAHFGAPQLPAVLGWLAASHQVATLLHELGEGAGRISEIVKALKSYAYLDQAPVQSIDVHEGLNNTLIILRHKLKSGIEVARHFASDMPRIQAYGSELNQVWTNLIDNACDALGGSGRITLRTRREEDWVIVEVQDNGPGIPAAIQPRVFDAFFTTKPPGKGTGLGLNISYNIVVYKHRGELHLYSQPGFTCFQVWLPVDFAAAKQSALDANRLMHAPVAEGS